MPGHACAKAESSELWIAVAAAVVALAYAVAFGTPRTKRNLLALLMLVAINYGPIALLRTWISGFPGWNMTMVAQQGRYQYLASALLCAAVAEAVRTLLQSGTTTRRLAATALAAWAVWLALGGFVRTEVVYANRPRGEVRNVLKSISDQVEAAGDAQTVYIENQPFMGVGVGVGLEKPEDYARTGAAFPGWGGVFMIASPDNLVAGKRVYFVERHADVLEALREDPRRRSAGLFIGEPGDERAAD